MQVLFVRSAGYLVVPLSSIPNSAVSCVSISSATASLDDLTELARRYGEDHVLVVSHQPSLGTWVYRLTGCRVRLTPGAVAILNADRLRPGGGELRTLLPPAVQLHLGARWSE